MARHRTTIEPYLRTRRYGFIFNMGLKLCWLTLLVTSIGLAANYDQSVFEALKWRNIGPNRGGRSLTCAGSTARPLEYYFGAVGGGLWKTTDGGTTWKPVTDGQLGSSSVGAVAVSKSNPDIVYIGMGETELRGNIMQGDGVYKSTDAGKTWHRTGLADTQAIARIRIDPKNPDLVYVAALGHPYGSNAERGVFRSNDGGKNWKKILYRDDHSGAIDLTLDPHNSRVLFAALWDVYRTPWLLNDGGPGSGFFKSVDGGDTWSEITRNPGLPKGIIGKIGVAVSGADSNRVYAMVEASDGGVFRSDDAGATWALVSQDRRALQRAFYFSRIYADPKEKDTIYVMDVAFLKSTNAGKEFKTIRPPHSDNHDLWIDPNNNQRMINSNDGGGNVSVDGGATWTAQDFPTAQLYHVAVTKDVPYQVCGAQQDSSTVCVQSQGGGLRRLGSGMFAPYYAVGGGESGYIAPDPKDPNVFYAGSQGALLTRFDRASGAMRDVQVYPLFFSGMPASSLKERWQWTYPIVFSPVDPTILYTSSQHLWKTTNQGQSWESISPDLTRADPKTLDDSGGPITKDQNGPEIYGTIFTIAPSLQDVNTIWTGSDDGIASITRDGGKHWTNITPHGLPEFSRISMIDASPHETGAALLVAKRYQLDDRKPYIYRTRDFGKSWAKIVNGIPEDDYVHVAREDPKRSGLLYAGTEHGIYVSFDDGDNWQTLRLNLPDTQVSDLLVQGDDLLIATHGRSFWVLDDIDILRQLQASVSASTLHVFRPDEAIRSFRPAAIDYFLQKQADKVTVEILDAGGKPVRSFTGSPADEKKRARGAENEDSEFGPPRTQPPGRKAGTNRFTWDLRYPGSTVFEGEIMWGARAEQGPMAVPGQYQVRVSANGQSEMQPLTIKLDPREHVTQAQLEDQFQLASKVRDEVSAADEMVIKIRQINKEAKERADKANDAAIASAGASLRDRLSTIEEEIYQIRNRANEDPLNFPIKLNNQIAALARTIETGDNPPTEQDYEVFRVLTSRFEAVQAKFNDAMKTDLAHFNEQLTSHKLAEIQPTGTPEQQ
jgi:photosystem II stability/assembly factor-like uncharacterized protein